MGTTTAKGFPYPFGFEGNNVPADLLAVANRIEDVLTFRTYDEISALGGVDLWDGRIVTQVNSGALRPWSGLYGYKAAAGIWQAIAPRASAPWTPTFKLGGTAVTLGTNGYTMGRYARFGSQAFGQFVIYTGSAGFSGTSSAAMTIDLPPAAPYKESSPPSPIGVLAHLDQTSKWTRADLVAGNTSATAMYGYKPGGGLGFGAIQTMASGGWANGQFMFGAILYETPEQS